MQSKTTLYLPVLIAMLLVGCGAPTVAVSHTLPAAVPLGADIGQLQTGNIAISGYDTAMAAPAKDMLAKRLAEAKLPPGSQTARVDAKVVISVVDKQTQRQMRRVNPQTMQIEIVDLPSLVRTIDLKAEFTIVDPSSGKAMLGVDTHRSYTSTGDPRMWGELGLARPDDPDQVPPSDTVLQEMFADCVEEFCNMLAPVIVTATIQMRPTLNSHGQAGLKAAGQGDFAAALSHLQTATSDEPQNVDLMFDRGVAAEAAGQLEEAIKSYQSAFELSKDKDAQAQAGAERVGLVISRLGKTK